jgi:hypothetical protein
MELNDSQVEERLNDERNLVNILRRRRTGRSDGRCIAPRIPDEIKTLVALNAEDGTRDKARAFGISHIAVSDIERGLNSRGEAMDLEFNELRKKRQETIKTKAEENLLEIIQAVQPRIKEEKKLKNLTSAAKDLASVAEKLSEKRLGSNASVVVYAPQISQENRYESIEVIVTS